MRVQTFLALYFYLKDTLHIKKKNLVYLPMRGGDARKMQTFFGKFHMQGTRDSGALSSV